MNSELLLAAFPSLFCQNHPFTKKTLLNKRQIYKNVRHLSMHFRSKVFFLRYQETFHSGVVQLLNYSLYT